MRPRVVLFDAVGTLLVPDPPVGEAYWRAGQAHGSRYDRRQVAERFVEAYRQVFTEGRRAAGGLATSEALEHRRWSDLVARVFDDVPSEQQLRLFDSLWHHFAAAHHWRLFPDVLPTWQELRARGYRLGVASNFDGRLRTLLRGKEVMQPSDAFFVSSEVGFAKPSGEFYRRTREALQVAAGEILLVGDDHENDVFAPRRCGWQAVEIDRAGASHGALSDLSRLLQRLP